jgi:hypothetical protein
MFAANRTDRVIGRIINLTVSIIVINCERGRGVPKGTKCAKKCFEFFIILNIKKENQKGKAKDRVRHK